MRLVSAILLVASCNFAQGGEQHHWQHGLSYFGEFKYPEGFAHFDYVNPDAPKGGRLVRAIPAYNSFTPLLAKGISAPGVGVIGSMVMYDSLMWPSGDEVGVYYGNLAEKMAVSDDATQIRIRLRPQARWHDGVPVTARDIKFTFEHIKANAFPGVQAAYASITQIDVVSEREVLFTYAYPVNLNAMMALGKVAMMPEHYWRTRDSSKTTIEPPLSSGPYRIGKFEIGKYVEFERVPDYWGYSIGLHRGRHNLDTIRYEVYRDATVSREALRKGLLDYYDEPSAAQWVTGYDFENLENGLLIKDLHEFKQYVGIVSALGFNLTRPRFQDVRVREALSLAFEFDWVNRILEYGVYQKPRSFFHDSFLAAVGLPSDDELALLEPFRSALPVRLFNEAPFAASTHSQLSSRDALVRAQALLQEAGWSMQDNQLVNSAGEDFAIEFLVNTHVWQRVLLPYTDRLQRLGIATSIRLVEAAQYVNLRRNNKSDAVIGSLAISFPPNQELPAYFASRSYGSANFARLSSPIVDALLEEVMSAPTRRALIAASHALDRVLYWQFYYIPIRALEANRVVIWDKFGRPAVQGRYRTAFPDAWWWDEAKAARVAAVLGRR
ncbi:MAG: extracellular solute-binding protein [Gammaproteobacteria bacterium]|nr:extracellular solute-binding protein [Gammaproteobacteria bacterium]